MSDTETSADDPEASNQAMPPQAPTGAAGKRKRNPGKAYAKPAKGPTRSRKGPVDQFGFRVGSQKSQAAAMYASETGATLSEVKAAVGSVQHNLLTELSNRPGIIVEKTTVSGVGRRSATRYKIIQQ